jgi:hypothetical protein
MGGHSVYREERPLYYRRKGYLVDLARMLR